MTSEFTCRGCGHNVMSPVPTGDRDKCLTCTFIETIPDAKDRADIRARLYDAEQMRFWAAHDAYVNKSYATRRCNHCHKAYRGPAVYCSQACAMADA